ncbi:hypothetical protein HU200_024710 [Digitaria exilis]|uniref:rRNA N-glycosylase n=1 Tax=Digitaria exilis TaxID=1010633 RepID=A0A835EY84_9POAL|nr:hypothetical protein HU200_024710 [Digitaria exilis]
MDGPVLTAELDVSRGSSYGDFISGVRDQLVVHAGATRRTTTSTSQLAFTDSYEDMKGTAELPLERVTLGKEELEAAVKQLAAAPGGQPAGDCEISDAHGGDGLRGHQVKKWRSLSQRWIGAALYGQPFGQPLAVAGADGRQQGVPQHLLAPVKIDCQDHAMMALGVVLNRQGPLQDEHKQALDEHWRTVRAQARKLDRERN